MFYPYCTLNDGTEAVYTPIIHINGEERIEVHFARQREDNGNFDTAFCTLPSHKWVVGTGFSDKEIAEFEKMLQEDEQEIYRRAREDDKDDDDLYYCEDEDYA